MARKKEKKEKKEALVTRTFTIEYVYDIYSLVQGKTELVSSNFRLDHKIRNSELNAIAKEREVSNVVAELTSQVDELRAMTVNDFKKYSYVVKPDEEGVEDGE